jgi:Tfp pilus assembly protein PilV
MTAPGDHSDSAWHGRCRGLSLPGKPAALCAERGFTLLEIVLSVGLTGLGILSLAGLLTVLGSLEAEETWDTKALFCAQEGIEELKFDVSSGNGPAGDGEATPAGPYGNMSRRWTVASSSDLEGLLEISVECAYDWKGKERAVGLETLVFAGIH